MNRQEIEQMVQENILAHIDLSEEVKDKFTKVFVDVVEVKAKEYASTDLKEMSESVLALTESNAQITDVNAHLKRMYMKLLKEHSTTLDDESSLTESMYNTPEDNEIHNSNALYLSGTQIGTRTGDYYQLYSDIDEQLPDDIKLDFDESGRVIAEPKDMVPLVKAVHLSVDRLQVDESLEDLENSEPVQVHALAGIKRLERQIDSALHHGELEEAKRALDELRELVKQYNNAVPPAEGIDLIVVKIKDYEKAVNEKDITEKANVLSPEKAASNILEMNQSINKQPDLLKATMALLGK